MFALFERLLKPTVAPERPEPPAGLVAFYWHFARQAKGLFVALFVAGFVRRAARHADPGLHRAASSRWSPARNPQTLFAEHWHDAARHGAACCCSCGPPRSTTQNLLANQAIAANVSNRIRWQNHWHVVRQSWAFFQNDFAGRIANRVMQTGPAIRESIVAMITSVWYILVYGTSALLLLARRRPVARAARSLLLVRRLSGAAAHASCRACATARRRCRRRARCSPAASSTATPTS